MRDPSWSAALLGARRDPVQAAAVAAATALLVIAASTGLLVEWTSGQAAIEQLVAAADSRDATSSADLVATLPQDAPEIASRVDERLDVIDGFDPAVLQVTSISWLVRSGGEAVRPVVRANGRIATAVMFHREDAIASLEVVAGPDADGEVWLPADLAERLRLAPGDTVEVGLEPVGAAATGGSASAVLAGTYATVDDRPAGVLADDVVRLPPAPGDRARPAALVLADAATVTRLGAALGDLQLTTLHAPITHPARYEDLRRGVDQLEQLQRDLYDAESELGSLIFERFDGPEVRVSSGIRRLTTQAVATADAVAAQTGSTATAGIVVAGATVAAAALAAARRRRQQTRLELVQGSAPGGVAVRGVLTAGPWVVLGAVVGRAVVLPVAGWVLPAARVPDPAVAALTPRAVAVAVVALAIVLAVRAGDAWLRLATLGGRERARSVPIVPMLVVAAVVVSLGVALGPPRPPTDPLVMVLPVVVIAAVAVLVLRATVALVPRGGDGGGDREPTAAWLARRRLAGQSHRLVAVGAVVATAAGLVAHTSVLRTSGSVAVEAKAAALAGAAAVVQVPDPTLARGPGMPQGHTVVLQDPSVRVSPEDVTATLLVVDPRTFALVATWPAGTTPGVLEALERADGASLPVLAVGGPTPIDDRGTLERGEWWTLPYEVVGRPAALPGSEPGGLLLLTSQDAVFSRLGAELDPRDGPLDPEASDADGPWRTQVWLDAPVDEALVALAAGVPPRSSGPELLRTLAQIRTQPAYLATTWSLGVLGGLGVIVLVLGLLLLGGTRARNEDEAGLELAVLQRLGVAPRRQRRAAVLERLLLVAAAGSVGIVTGTGLATLVLGAADPAPDVVPPLTPVLPTEWLLGLAGVLVAGGLVAGLLDHRAARRADVEEALRVAR